MNKQYVNWFEIPVNDMERAAAFYKTVFNIQVMIDGSIAPGFKMGLFPYLEGSIGGALVEGPGYAPTEHGPSLYLNGGDDLNEALSKVEAAGGKVLIPKTKISDEFGYYAFFLDSEGNRLGLHSQN